MLRMMRLEAGEKPILLFTGLYLTLAAIVSLTRGNSEFVLYVAVMLVLGSVVLVAHRRVRFSAGVLWGLSIWGLIHMAGGLVPAPESWPINGTQRVLYSVWFIPDLLKYDHVVHAYGFGLTTVLCWQGLRSIVQGQRTTSSVNAGSAPVRPTFGMLTLCVAAGTGFGALNEVIEFIATLMLPETNIGGYENAGWDMVANLVGATVAAIGIRICDHSET